MKSLILAGFLFGTALTASSYAQKDPDSIEFWYCHDTLDSTADQLTLDSFGSIQDFKEWYSDRQQRCLDGSGMGECPMQSCFGITWDIWLKEVYIYFDRLKRSIPDPTGKILFGSARKEWEISYAKTAEFSGYVFSRRWDSIWGTMYLVIEHDELNNAFVPLFEQHALLLKSLADNKPMEKERSPEYWDNKLNISYRKLMEAAGRPGKVLLRAAEMQWIKARDAEIKLIDYILAIRYKSRQYAYARIERATEKRNMVSSIIRQRATMFDTLIEFSKPARVRYKKWIDG